MVYRSPHVSPHLVKSTRVLAANCLEVWFKINSGLMLS